MTYSCPSFSTAEHLFRSGCTNQAEAVCRLLREGNPGEIPARHLLSVILLRDGRLTEGEAVLREALALAPENIELLRLHVDALCALKRPVEALAPCRTLAILRPGNGEVWRRAGVCLMMAGRPEDALAVLTHATDIDAADFRAWVETGHALNGLERTEQALAAFDAALKLAPDCVEARIGYGLALLKLDHPLEALACFDLALRSSPRSVEAHIDRGNALIALDRPEDALASYAAALRIQPDAETALYNQGTTLQALGRWEQALAAFDRVLQINPENAEALSNRAVALFDLGRLDEALASCDAALRIAPEHAGAHTNRGNVLNELDRPEDALVAYDAAIRIEPDYAEAHSNRGTVLYALGDRRGSHLAFDRSLKIRPDATRTHLHLAHVLLDSGELAAGWKELEWRSRDSILQKAWSEVTLPFWQGEPLEGRRLLLNAEQGFGDVIQFARYAPLIADTGGRVTLRVPPPLIRLMRQSLGAAVEIASTEEPKPEADFELMMMSAPAVLAGRLDDIPARIPYLSALPEEVETWRTRLADLPGLRIGLSWAGGRRPNNPAAQRMDRKRSLPPSLLAALSDVAGVSWISLQKGISSAELAEIPQALNLQDVSEDLVDFAATAAVIETLDLVIAVDTSVAHLAGALGKPVWILSRFNGCWRWQRNRSDSPWYPSATLYRQTRPGAWDEVLGRIARDLGELALTRE